MYPDNSLPDGILLDPMTRDDLEEVLAIEKAAFATPWTRDLFAKEFLTPISRSILARITIEGRRILAGYAIFWIIADGVDILKIAVKSEFRRRGLATHLMNALISSAQNDGCLTAILEVRRSNTAAIRLYEKLGFAVKGIRRGYYSESGEDALTMGRDIAPL